MSDYIMKIWFALLLIFPLHALIETNNDKVQIDTEQSIFCQGKICRSKGKVIITRDAERASATEMILYFILSNNDINSYQLKKITLTGNVCFTKGKHISIKGDYSIYKYLTKELIIGGKPQLKDQDTTINVANKIIFYNQGNMAQTVGKVTIKNKQTLMLADDAKIYFVKNLKQQMILKSLKAKGNIVISTEKEIVKAQKAVYNPQMQTIKLFNNVVINSKNAKLSGNYAIHNINTGKSKMFNKNEKTVIKIFKSK